MQYTKLALYIIRHSFNDTMVTLKLSVSTRENSLKLLATPCYWCPAMLNLFRNRLTVFECILLFFKRKHFDYYTKSMNEFVV